MKKTFLTFIMAIFAITAFSQNLENKTYVPNGYQGFLEEGNTWHFDKNMKPSIQLSTTHGFYFNDNIYAGMGLGLDFNSDNAMVPIYTNIRYVFVNRKAISPFVSLRLGSYMSDDMGAYGDLAFGMRFSSKRDFAVSILVAGCYFDKITVNKYQNGMYQDVQMSPAGISLRMGIEW